MIRNVSKKV